MKHQSKVVWKEGMFIAPQHFQQQERHIRQYIQRFVEFSGGGLDSGLTVLDIETNYLKLGKLSISHCSGIFPDGSLFDCNRELVLDVPEGTSGKTIYLALPLSIDGENEYGEREEQRRFVTTTVSLFDDSDETQSAVETLVAQPNISLVLEGADLTGLTVLPVARVLECRDGGELVLDRGFIPACLHLGASLILKERLKEITLLAQARANTVVQRIGVGQQTKSDLSLMRDYLWLQTLNRWLPWLHLTLEQPQTRIDVVYEKLCSFNGELDSFIASVAEQPMSLASDNLKQVFAPVFAGLRDKLSVVQSDSVTEFDWDDGLFEKRRLLRLSVANLAQLEDRRFVLSVQSSVGSAALMQQFIHACTLSGLSNIADLVRNSQSGVGLKALPVAPNELKSQADTAYFEIDVAHEYWQQMKQKREPIALHVDSRIPDLSIKLYALG